MTTEVDHQDWLIVDMVYNDYNSLKKTFKNTKTDPAMFFYLLRQGGPE